MDFFIFLTHSIYEGYGSDILSTEDAVLRLLLLPAHHGPRDQDLIMVKTFWARCPKGPRGMEAGSLQERMSDVSVYNLYEIPLNITGNLNA